MTTDISKFMTIDIGDISKIMTIAVNAATYGNRGCFMGGNFYNTIQYVTLNSPGNAIDGGDLTLARYAAAGCSNGAYDRGLFAGGYSGSFSNVIDYFTVSTASNASDFGDLNYSYDWMGAGSNDTNDRGIFSLGGFGGGTFNGTNHIDYVTISTAGNATNFGNLTVAVVDGTMASNGTNERGTIAGGVTADPTYTNTIQYITINTTGNSVDFGDLYAAVSFMGGTSNGTNERGIYGGGQTTVKKNEISYITINSLGNSTDFGDLTSARHAVSATSNSTGETGVFGGGNTTVNVNTIDYITINSVGNASDFGDLIRADIGLGACSNGAARQNFIGDRGLFVGGRIGSTTLSDTTDCITISTTGNAVDCGGLSANIGWASGASNGSGDRLVYAGGVVTTSAAYSNVILYTNITIGSGSLDFGDLTISVLASSSTSNGVNNRAVFMGGVLTGGSRTNTIGYVTISTTGNAADFGDFTLGRNSHAAGNSNTTNERGMMSGGYSTTTTNIIDYFTINSAGNASDFGDLTVARNHCPSVSNGTDERGVTSGGENGSTTIDYVTINSAGNAADFGDCTGNYVNSGLSNMTNNRGVFGGGVSYNTLIEYVTINSAGNTTDFGDLTVGRDILASASNS